MVAKGFGLDDEFEKRHRMGRLAEDAGAEEKAIKQLLRGGLVRGRSLSRGALTTVNARSTRPLSKAGKVAIHFRHAAISKIPARSIGAASKGGRDASRSGHRLVEVFPSRSDVRAVRAAGGVYDRLTGAYRLQEVAFKAAPESVRRLAGKAAKSAWINRRQAGRTGTKLGGVRGSRSPENTGDRERGYVATPGSGNTGTRLPSNPATRVAGKPQVFRCQPGTAARYQRYIERADLMESDRREAVVTDAAGYVSWGVLGQSPGERAAFWDRVEDRERADGRVQCQLIVEVPHELPPAGIRAVARHLVEVLVERGLPYHVAAHWPEVEHGSDERNVHLHVVYSDRPAERVGEFDWNFSSRKDREARDAAWIAGWRERYVEAVNGELARVGSVKRYDARSYEDMGIDKRPGQHLGPAEMTRVRAGEAPATAVANAEAEVEWLAVRRERDGAGAPLSLGVVDGPVAARARRLLTNRPGGFAAAEIVEREKVRARLLAWEGAAQCRFEAEADWAGRLPWSRIQQRRTWATGELAKARSEVARGAAQRCVSEADQLWELYAAERPQEVLEATAADERRRRLAQIEREELASLQGDLERLEGVYLLTELRRALLRREGMEEAVRRPDRRMTESGWSENLRIAAMAAETAGAKVAAAEKELWGEVMAVVDDEYVAGQVLQLLDVHVRPAVPGGDLAASDGVDVRPVPDRQQLLDLLGQAELSWRSRVRLASGGMRRIEAAVEALASTWMERREASSEVRRLATVDADPLARATAVAASDEQPLSRRLRRQATLDVEVAATRVLELPAALRLVQALRPTDPVRLAVGEVQAARRRRGNEVVAG